MRVPEALTALAEAPLMPVTKAQRQKMGNARSDECLNAQAVARGLSDASAATESTAATFPKWTSRLYRDATLSAVAWARMAAVDANAGSRKCMNHVCLPKTCHKGRWAKIGFCRMFFWHWVQRLSKKGDKMVMARAHGHALQLRSTDADWPPVQDPRKR